MKNCPYLIFKEPTGCVDCSGFRCTAGSREKKLSDVSICQNEEAWRECAKYLSLQPNADELILSTPLSVADTSGLIDVKNPQPLLTPPATPEAPAPLAICPYLGDIPPEGCCSATCYAKGVRVAIRKCRSWETCTRYLIAKLSETPFRGGR